MNDEREVERLSTLSRELSEHALHHIDRCDGEALFQARRLTLRTLARRRRGAKRSGGWLAATAVAGVVALCIAILPHLWNVVSTQPQSEELRDFVAGNVIENNAPWHEDLDMLQNMDFSLWLDMAGPEDAG